MQAAWSESLKRCSNPAHRQYKYYGGRGIRYCKRWQNFENFLKDMGPRPPGMTLERKNNNRGYSKSNCQWATRCQQTRNRRNTLKVTYKGMTRTLPEWAEIAGIDYYTLKARVTAGYTARQVLTKPVKCGEKLPDREYPRREAQGA
jgi:hypothetical protein